MNTTEKKMLGILKRLKEVYGAISVRAEFEAEGTSLDELLRLKELSMKSDLGLALKIGGCESVRDILEVRAIGVDYLIAPMIESPYALRKYLQAVDKFIPGVERAGLEIHCNIETLTAFQCLDELLAVPEIASLKGLVIERVDLCFSQGRREDEVDSPLINGQVEEIIMKAKSKGLLGTIGGGVSANSLPLFKKMAGQLDRFETRKVCFSGRTGITAETEKAILLALGFELLWLRNKADYKAALNAAESQRIDLIEGQYGAKIRGLTQL